MHYGSRGSIASIIAWIGLALAPVASAQSAHPSYVVEASSGTVSYWAPWSSRWRQVNDQATVPERSLLQVAPGSQAIIYLPATPQRGKRSIIITKPMIVRLHPDLLRDVRIERELLDKLPDEISQEDKDPLDSLTSEIGEAWDKVMAVVGQIQAGTKAAHQLEKLKKEQDALVRGEDADFKLLTPKAEAPQQLKPTEGIHIRWTRAKNYSGRYDIYFGEDKDALEKIGSTQGSSYTLPITRTGVYWVRVDADGASTKKQMIRVIEPKASGPIDVAMIETESPPLHLELLSASDSQEITFSWLPDSAVEKYQVVLKVEGRSKNFLTSFNQISLKLKPGHYRWHIEAYQGERILARSPSGTLKISPPATRLAELVREALEIGQTQSFLIEGRN